METTDTLDGSFDRTRYEAHEATIAILMGRLFLRHLNRLYREFDGDLLLPIVLGEIAHHNVLRVYSRNSHCLDIQERMYKEPDWRSDLDPTNAFSISEATGIPRETVRRKIDKLQRKGWLIKSARGELIVSETVREHFTKDFNIIVLTDLLETSGYIRMLLGQQGKQQRLMPCTVFERTEKRK